MDSTTRQAALRVVAKLTWGGGWSLALACSAGATSHQPEQTGTAVVVPEPPSTSGGGPLSEAIPTPIGGSGGEATSLSGGASGDSSALASGAAGSGALPSAGGAGGEPSEGAGGAGGASPAECTSTVAFDPNQVMVVSIPEEELACCVAEVLDRMADPAAKTDPRVVNCCTAIVVGSNSRSPHYGSDVRRYCCSDGVVAEPSALYSLPYCTPWGPPVPPAMPGANA